MKILSFSAIALITLSTAESLQCRAHAHGRTRHVPKRGEYNPDENDVIRSDPRRESSVTYVWPTDVFSASNYPLILSCHFLHSFTADRSDLTSKSTGGGALLNPRPPYDQRPAYKACGLHRVGRFMEAGTIQSCFCSTLTHKSLTTAARTLH